MLAHVSVGVGMRACTLMRARKQANSKQGEGCREDGIHIDASKEASKQCASKGKRAARSVWLALTALAARPLRGPLDFKHALRVQAG